MRPLSLDDLPPPPPGRTGWPWTEAPDAAPAEVSLPRFTVVTPAFNQGCFLEETIRSVLLQGYPNLEYVVLDGGSDDGSMQILERYGGLLTKWRSLRDDGQAAAIAEGFAASGADLLAWLNSDDVYLPGALRHIAAAARENPRAVILGAVQEVDEQGRVERLVRQRGIELDAFVRFWEERYAWHQPGLFVPRSLYETVGGLDRSLSLVFDHDLLCRLLQRAPVLISDQPVACFRKHRTSKSHLHRYAFLAELGRVAPRYWGFLPPERREGCRPGLARALARGVVATLIRGRLRESVDNLLALGALARTRP